jgi:acetyl-CoA C-acetyltransferase
MPQPVVLAGVAHLRANPAADPTAGREPLALLADVAREAAADAGSPGLLTQLDGINVVGQITWNYDDLAGRLAHELGAPDARTEIGRVGGDTPLLLLAAAADRISRGETCVELVCAAEALSSLRAASLAAVDPEWSATPGGPFALPDDWRGSDRMLGLGLDRPVRVYPLFENALRARLGQTFAEAQDWTGRIYSAFSRVAAGVPAAWDQKELGVDDILAVTPENRMVCWPYPLRVNSRLMVDQAAAVLLVAPQIASTLLRRHPAVYLLGTTVATVATDATDVFDRLTFGAAEGLDHAISGVLDVTGTAPGDLSALDLYSCFPVVPKLASLALGLGQDATLTTTGGMNSFGGPGNGYSLHGVITCVQAVREHSGRALVYANGEYLTKHAAAVLGREVQAPRRSTGPAPSPGPRPHDGPAENVSVETYTVEFDRGAVPSRGWVVVRTPDGARAGAVVVNKATLTELTDAGHEPIGRSGRLVRGDDPPLRFELS